MIFETKESKLLIQGGNSQEDYGSSLSDKLIVSILCLVFLSFALAVGIISSKPFTWPFNWDSLRDIGIAQTILDGTYPMDPILSGEVNWYNPLTGAIIALWSYILQLPLPETCIRIGPFLQLLLPITMVLLAWNRFGPWSGFFILTYSLFARHPLLLPEWFYSCYSPWLLAPQWGKSFLFLMMLTFLIFIEKRRTRYALFTGVLLGIGFLVHTAVLIEGSLFILVYSFVIIWQNYKNSDIKTWYVFAFRIFWIFLLALIVSSPYWIPIFFRYQFIIRNPYPSLYVTSALEWKHLPITLQRNLNGFTVIGVVSIIFLFIHWRDEKIRWLKIWTGVVLLLVLQQFACHFLFYYGYTFPSFIPPHHTFMSIHALIGFWFIYGVAQIANRIVNLFKYVSNNRWLYKGVYIFSLSLIFLICINTVPKPIPPLHEIYRGREANRLIYEVSKYDGAYRWILHHTSTYDTFLSDERTAVWVLLPSARKLFYIMMFYMNPYVDMQLEYSLYDLMWKALSEERFSDFISLCIENHVKYVLVPIKDEKKRLLDRLTRLSTCYHDNEVVIYKLNYSR